MDKKLLKELRKAVAKAIRKNKGIFYGIPKYAIFGPVAAAVLAVVMVFSLGSGIFSFNKGTNVVTDSLSEATNTVEPAQSSAPSAANAVSDIKSDILVSKSVSNYDKPMYDIAQDYTFVLSYNGTITSPEEAVKITAKSDGSGFNFCDYETSAGMIKAKPKGLVLTGDRLDIADKWGELSSLYLVRYIDFATGEKLSTPKVTPITVAHDLPTPKLSQSVSSSGIYTLSWPAVDGADYYVVYGRDDMDGIGYKKVAETDATSVIADSIGTSGAEGKPAPDGSGYVLMNSQVRYKGDNDCKYVVKAFSNSGKSSGISNEVDVRDVAAMLPYSYAEEIVSVNITDPMDVPVYVNVTTVDNGTAKMLINYHGAKVGRTEGVPDETTIMPTVYNISLRPFTLKLKGVNYDSVMAKAKEFASRQDTLNRSSSSSSGSIVVGIDNNTDIEAAPTVEPTKSAPIDGIDIDVNYDMMVSVPSGGTTYDLFMSALSSTADKISQLPDLKQVLYAENSLEYWLAYALTAQIEKIPVPICVFPEAADYDNLIATFTKTYRQNPCAGVISGVTFSHNYETFNVSYCEPADQRLGKTAMELAAAKGIADKINSSEFFDSDAAKIYAVNDYICDNVTYDFNSASTDVDLSANPGIQFIDSHTPYGALINRLCVCEGYAEAFALITRYMGFDSVMDTGYFSGGFHEWNKIRIGGNWYVVDVTNNDNDNSLRSTLLTSDAMSGSNLISDGEALPGNYAATDDSLDWYVANGAYASSIEDASRLLAERYKAGLGTSIKLSSDLSQSDVRTIVDGAFNNMDTPPASVSASFANKILTVTCN